VGDNIIVAAHDLITGKQIWQVKAGTHDGGWGFSNAPVLYKDTVIVDGDGKADSFLIALNKTDGSTAWRNKRTNKGISYSAPYIRELAGKTQMIQCGDRCVTSFNPNTGESLWTVDGPSEEFAATPVYSEATGLLFISSSWPKTILKAVRPDGQGNVTGTHVVWSDTKGAPYVPSMMAVGDFLLTINRGGNAFFYEAATGEVLWKEKLGRHHASPVLIDGKIVCINDDGQINMIQPGKTFKLVATHELGESCYASPAISKGQIFIRGFKHLYCFGQKHVAPR
jgi:outer membrane protein assembly factor BamB